MTSNSPEAHGAFATTHWSVVVTAGRHDTERSKAALEKLCGAYWFPLYAYVRRRGYSVEDAQDLTQQFFARVIERNLVARADQSRGQFRSFLLGSMEHFLANEWDKSRALKRGGGLRAIPIQTDNAETRYGVEPPDNRTPEQVFEYNWALALLEHVMQNLEAEYKSRENSGLFATLKPCLVGSPAADTYAELAKCLDLNEGAVRVAVHRLRTRYRELLRGEIANTVDSEAEVDAEMRHLFKVLAQR
jgi:DNA-directed RNA polymerase specialized sigma24 family protein